MYRGQVGESIKEIQEALNQKGFNVKVDGVFGEETYKAVVEFQKRIGIPADGIVCPLTLTKLFANTVEAFPIKEGMSGFAVVQVQDALRRLGFKVAVDGVFGKQTLSAVKEFQKQNNLTVDGVVGKKTINAMLKKLDYKYYYQHSTGFYQRLNFVPEPTLKPGMKSYAVKILQFVLCRLGYSIAVDGVYGNQTAGAVKDFQKRRGITVDGIYGPQTANELKKAFFRPVALRTNIGDIIVIASKLKQQDVAGIPLIEFNPVKYVASSPLPPEAIVPPSKSSVETYLPSGITSVDGIPVKPAEQPKKEEPAEPKPIKKPQPKLLDGKVVVLDVQHLGKVSRPADRGAFFAGKYEADINLEVAEKVKAKLTELGATAYILVKDTGRRMDYQERHKFAKEINANLYLAMHLNAGRGNYSYWGYISTNAKGLAEKFASVFYKNYGLKAIIKKLDTTTRGYICISGIPDVGILCEPLFIDTHLNEALNTEKLASVYVEAITSCL